MTQELMRIHIALRAIHTISDQYRYRIIELLLKHEDGLPLKEIAFALQCETKIITGHVNYLMKEFMVTKKFARMKNSLKISNVYMIHYDRRNYVKQVFDIITEKVVNLEEKK